ncbi:hypothetical protein MGH68_14760 [Erysipelothrix sp. D19-032]
MKIDYTNAIYYAEAITNTPNDTPSRRKIFNENPHLVDEDGRPNAPIVRTITTKQDRHPNSGVILHDLHIAGNHSLDISHLENVSCLWDSMKVIIGVWWIRISKIEKI